MKVYKANDELANVLLYIGFTEKNAYPDNPSKRLFSYSKKSSIGFENISIKIYHGSTVIADYYDLTNAQLKDILTFFKLPEVIKTDMIRNHRLRNITELVAKIKEEEVPFVYSEKKYSRIVEIYESIVLPI